MFAENGVTRLLLMLLLPVLGMAALAEENPPKESIISAANLHGWYAGAGYATTDGFDSQNTGGQSDNGFIVNGGYRFNHFLAVEAGYLQDSNIKSGQLSGLFILPFLQRWEVYAKVGWSRWNADTAPPGNDDDRDTFLGGVGAGVTFGKHWHARLEYQAFNLDTCADFNPCSRPDPGSFDSILAELHYRFGRGWE
jgi:opacity protein-like surface antigen